VEAFKELTILPGLDCCEPLDIIKSFPEFEGKQETYVFWRQAAKAAYKVFEPYNGSIISSIIEPYQAVAILRNKVRDPAAAVLASSLGSLSLT